MQKTTVSNRIEALDYLRGFFILIIIVDHLWRWPNIFEFVSGRGELWVSAAEGFVIISGLLVGYVRGRKGLKKSFGEVSKKLITRGVMLYIWAIVTTVLLAFVSWYFSFKSSVAFIPYAPYDWTSLLHDTITLTYAHTLTHFLYLYAIFLVLAPCIIWLLRRGLWWAGIIVSSCLWVYGYIHTIEWMQWQMLFYLPAIGGFYLDQMIALLRRTPKQIIWACTIIVIGSIAWSAITILPTTPGTYQQIGAFQREPLGIGRILLSFAWFAALAWVFHKSLALLEKSIGWLLLPIGTRSLTAYIAHSLPLMLLSLFIPPTTGFWTNSFLAAVAIIITWAIVIIPGINRIIPR